ncbi:MAG: LysR family transcriptional regulator [Hydrogenophaga sp.]|nr:LysR family transcriptional regulator [Hydrogenophaga sp.]
MRINKLDLNQLLLLDAMLATASVGQAATLVHLSQPAVSAALAKFRDYFGDPLLVPHGRRLMLTPFAHTLVEPVRDLMLQVQALTRRRPEIEASRIERQITIVGSDYIQNILLAPLFRRAEREAPGLKFEVRSISGYLSEELDQGDVDLVVSLASGVSDRHPSEIVFRDTFSCLTWTGNTRVNKRLSKAQYLSMGHVAVLLGRGRVPTLDQIALDALGMERRVEVRIPSFSMMPVYLVETERIGTLQTHLATALTKQWPVRVLPCPIPIAPIITAVQWHRYQTLDPAISWTRSVLRELGATLQT